MSFVSDFDYIAEGNVIVYNTTRAKRAFSLPIHAAMSEHFHPVEGRVTISVKAVDINKQAEVDTEGAHIDPEGQVGETGAGNVVLKWNQIGVEIEIFPPGQPKIQSITVEPGLVKEEFRVFTFSVSNAGPEGEWEVRVTNKDSQGRTAFVLLKVHFSIDRKPLLRQALPHGLLSHAYLVILQALNPSININGNRLTIRFGQELLDFFGERGDTGPLGTQEFDISPIEGRGFLNTFDIRARSGRALLAAVQHRYQEVKDALGGMVLQVANEGFRRQWESLVDPDDIVIHIHAGFSDIQLVVIKDYGPFQFDPEFVIQKATVDVYITFKGNLRICNVLALTPTKIELADFEAKVADQLGLVPTFNSLIQEYLPGAIQRAAGEIGRFLGEAMVRLVRQNGVFHSLTADDSNWIVHFTDIPSQLVPVSVTPPIQISIPSIIHGPTGEVGGTGGVLDPSAPTTPDASLGVLPPENEFIVVKPETLARLDKIKTFVFIMMENRSFDHMLGRFGHSQYEGLTGHESNPVVGRPYPVRMRYAGDLVHPPPVTQILQSPNHNFKPVERQIADGAMDGFAQDFENRYPGFAELVMTYYTPAELKTYDVLAANYKVCDQWYCAHAGPTFPNRFVTLTGLTPELNNYDINDPILGFLPQKTIFDLLNELDIEWAVYESDFSIIRMFKQFRLNSSQVRPFVDRDDDTRKVEERRSFVEVAKRGELPSVVFVEPNFVDIPPIHTGNDDHAPADLRRGQNFIAEVVGALAANRSKWRETMLVITYDEHGGFYDHVAPPGTKLGPSEFLDKDGVGTIPRVHPDGQKFMGPRVPSFVISPFVNASSVCHDILDHTSIIKTILLRFRNNIPTRVFTQFGPRVNMIAHLGVALDLDEPRSGPPPVPPQMQIRQPSASQVALAPLIALESEESDNFHESLRRAQLPKPPGKSLAL